MGDVIDFVSYRERKLEKLQEQEWNLLDQIYFGLEDTATFTLTLSDENGNIIYSSDGGFDDNPK